MDAMFKLKNRLYPAGLVWSRRAAARLIWSKDGYAGAQFDQPLSAISRKCAA
jgi:hypothetical protein